MDMTTRGLPQSKCSFGHVHSLGGFRKRNEPGEFAPGSSCIRIRTLLALLLTALAGLTALPGLSSLAGLSTLSGLSTLAALTLLALALLAGLLARLLPGLLARLLPGLLALPGALAALTLLTLLLTLLALIHVISHWRFLKLLRPRSTTVQGTLSFTEFSTIGKNKNPACRGGNCTPGYQLQEKSNG
jgi:hypothetical protein